MPDFGASIAFSAIFALGVTGGTAVTAIVSAGVLLGTVAPIALALGASYLAAQKDIAPVNDNNGLQSVLKQAIPAQRLILGRATTGGALFFYKASPPYLWTGILLAAHQVDAFENLFINGYTVFIGSDGFATSSPFRDGSNKYIEVSFRDGSIDQPIDPIIARDFPSMPATFRQRGHATIVIKANYGFGGDRQSQDDDHKRIFGDDGQFQPTVRMRGAHCHDPRKAGSVLGDPTTWTWTDNAPLCMARYLTHQWPDTRLVDPARIDWDRLAVAADAADKWETGKDGTAFRRNTVNGVIQSTDQPWDVIENLKIAAGSHLILDRGKVYSVARARREPVATFHQAMIVGGVEYASEPRDRDLVNIMKPTFVAPDREYQEVAGPVLRRADLIALDGKARESSLRGAFVEDSRRIQRLASAALNQARLGRTLTTGATLEAMQWSPGQILRVEFTGVLARCNGLYELMSKEWDDRMSSYRLSLLQYDPTVNDFDPATEQDFVLDDAVLAAEAA